MSLYLGIDTSNYTTSLALVADGEVVKNLKKSVYVAENMRGIRQSDALFCHVKNLPILMEELGELPEISAIGYSAKPRDVEGSYMPCFLAGELLARSLAASRGVPAYPLSHQAGHIRAALYSSGALNLKDERFLAFHVSGGTTELLLVEGNMIKKIGGTEDLTAGQAIDRTGVMLGIPFPCGAELEKLADGICPKNAKICVQGLLCHISGLENQTKKMFEEGVHKEEIAAYTIEFVRKTVEKLSENALREYGTLPIVYAGGVMSCGIIQRDLKKKFDCHFAAPAFSADNACGIALLAAERMKNALSK